MNRRASRWPRRVPSLRVPVPCSGGTHTITWRRGALVLDDHDVAADAVLVALGGAPPACLEVRTSWRLGYIEVEGSAGPTDGLVRSLSTVAAWMGAGGRRPAVLPEPLRRLREASLLHTWERGLHRGPTADATQLAFLERAVSRRVRDLALAQARRACGHHWTPQDIDVEVCHDAACAGTATGGSDARAGSARIHVPLNWLTSVWVPGLEVLDGELVLAVGTTTAARSGRVARWLADGAGGWELAASWVG